MSQQKKKQQQQKTGCGCRYEGNSLCQICPSEVEDKFEDLEEEARVSLCSDQKPHVLAKICTTAPAKNFLSGLVQEIAKATGVEENMVVMGLMVGAGLLIYHQMNGKKQNPYPNTGFTF